MKYTIPPRISKGITATVAANPIHEAVEGMNCMRPRAPEYGFVALGSHPDSKFINL